MAKLGMYSCSIDGRAYFEAPIETVRDVSKELTQRRLTLIAISAFSTFALPLTGVVVQMALNNGHADWWHGLMGVFPAVKFGQLLYQDDTTFNRVTKARETSTIKDRVLCRLVAKKLAQQLA